MSIHPIHAAAGPDPVTQARIDLAAALRLAVFHQLEEGIDNHFTLTVPGAADQFLALPFGCHWSEARAGELLVFNEQGDTLQGEGLSKEPRSASMRRCTVSPGRRRCCTPTRPGPPP